jgi:hypothetical protein
LKAPAGHELDNVETDFYNNALRFITADRGHSAQLWDLDAIVANGRRSPVQLGPDGTEDGR